MTLNRGRVLVRQITGAMITISKYDDASDDASKQDRTITIKGNADQVALAQYLINTRYQILSSSLIYQLMTPAFEVRINAPLNILTFRSKAFLLFSSPVIELSLVGFEKTNVTILIISNIKTFMARFEPCHEIKRVYIFIIQQ